jgi:DNA-binding PadR family transcriptional regulator
MARKPSAGPASDPELLILSSLANGPKHGWAIMGDIETFAGVTIGPGTLYNAITRLVEKRTDRAARGRWPTSARTN